MNLDATQCGLVAQVLPVLLLTAVAEVRLARPPRWFVKIVMVIAILDVGLIPYSLLLADTGATSALEGSFFVIAVVLTGAVVIALLLAMTDDVDRAPQDRPARRPDTSS